MKKYSVLLLFSMFLSFPFFAQESELATANPTQQLQFLLGLSGNFEFGDLSIGKETSYYPCFSVIPAIDTEFRLPIQSNFKMQLGLKTLPAIAVNYIEIISRFGCELKEPQNWNNYHFEILGNVGVGIQLGFITCISVTPYWETGVQFYLMPENKGLFVGAGPNLFFFKPIENIYPLEIFPNIEITAGYKF